MKSFCKLLNLLLQEVIVASVIKKWLPPPENHLKLNIDGSFFSSTNYGGVWGVIRDHKGGFVAGFSHIKHYVSSPLHIELLAIKEGLLLLQAIDVSHVVIHSDCLLVGQSFKLN